jgi:hypothetical protein
VKNLLVILDDPIDTRSQPCAVKNALSSARADRELPEGVSRILGNSFLIDTHKCLPFFVLLLNTAKSYQCRVAVLSVDEENFLTKELDLSQIVAPKP